MKWSLATALFSASAIAIPVVPAPDAFPYNLVISSQESQLNGRHLSVVNGTTIGLFKSTNSAKRLEVFAVPGKDRKGLVELHTYPQGVNEKILTLIGTEDVLNLQSLTDPAASKGEPDKTVDWQSFRLSGGNPPAPGRPANSLVYAGGQGSWIAFPVGNKGDWLVQFKGPNALLPAISMPIDVVYTRALEFETEDGIITIA